jgi:DNA-binding NtrC family response regulator
MADSVLLIDDDVDVLRSIGNVFEQAGYEVARELDAEAGLAAYDRLRPEVVLLDLHLPGMDGLDALARFKERNAAVIVLTGHAEVSTAVQAMQLGAENFLTKPVDLQHLLAAVARVADKVRLRRLNELLLLRAAPDDDLDSLGKSPMMKDLLTRVGLASLSERTPVLLTGESGVGKGWLAEMMHQLSPRAQGPYLTVSFFGRSAQDIDVDLFGAEFASVEQARERRPGLVETAAGGSLFVEEIADLPLELQPKLLRLLETRTFRRVGGTRDLTTDVRLLAATAKDLSQLAEEGLFRDDLLYRLNVMPVHLPALRERPREDRLTLLVSLVNELQEGLPGAPAAIGPEALERLLAHPWPGNVREMRNVLERALILARGSQAVGLEHLPGEFRNRPGPGDRRHTPMTLDELERAHIERTMRHHGGNRTRAAQELGISRATLINKIKKFAIGS